MIYNLLHPILSGALDASISDEEVIEQYVMSQQARYFDILYDRYSDKVYAKCVSMLKDSMLAEDAVQDIFMKVLLNISKFKGQAKFSTWLYSITYNFCIDHIRRRKKEQSMTTDVDDIQNLDAAIDDDDSDILETQVHQMKIVLEKLRVVDKAILLMKYQDDMSIKDMTSVLDKSESAIKMSLKRAKEKFRRQYSLLYQSA